MLPSSAYRGKQCVTVLQFSSSVFTDAEGVIILAPCFYEGFLTASILTLLSVLCKITTCKDKVMPEMNTSMWERWGKHDRGEKEVINKATSCGQGKIQWLLLQLPCCSKNQKKCSRVAIWTRINTAKYGCGEYHDLAWKCKVTKREKMKEFVHSLKNLWFGW